MKSLNQQIAKLHAELLRKEKMEVHLTNVRQRLKERQQELKEYEQTLDAEQFELEKLEKLSLKGLFFNVLGNKEQQMEQKRQAYLLAFLQYHECKKQIDAKLYEISIMEEQLAKLTKVKSQLKQLLQKKRMQLKFKNKALAGRLIVQEEKIRIQRAKLKELKEAYDFGDKAREAVARLFQALQHMKTWNRLGDNPQASINFSFYNQKKFVKRKMNDVARVHKLFIRFTDELRDVEKKYKLNYSDFIQHLNGFMQRFYDGLISDWIFHKEVTISMNITLETLDKIKRLLAILENESETTKTRIQEEKDTLQDMVIFLDT